VLLPTFALYFIGALSWHAIAAGIVATAIAATWLAWKFMRRLGGYTGDCLGAVQQVAEAAFYLAVLAVES